MPAVNTVVSGSWLVIRASEFVTRSPDAAGKAETDHGPTPSSEWAGGAFVRNLLDTVRRACTRGRLRAHVSC